jgi:hypothetical protein
VAEAPYHDMEAYFGVTGGQVNVVVAPLSGRNDGSGGAYHRGCDFSSGGTLYLDATFALANALDVAVVLYIAELSECFMGAQGRGWGGPSSNGEPTSPLTCYGVSGTAGRVYYVDAHGHVHELAWENRWVNTGDLTAGTGASAAGPHSGLTATA